MRPTKTPPEDWTAREGWVAVLIVCGMAALGAWVVWCGGMPS